MLGYQPSDKTMQVMGAKYFLLLSWPISALSFRVRLRGRNVGLPASDKAMQVMGAKYFLLLSWPISALSFRVRLRGRNGWLPAQRQDNASDGGEVFPPPIMAYIGAII